MRQQLVNLTRPMCGQSRQHIFEIGIWIVPVHARRLDKAHDSRRSLARAQATGEQPVRSAKGNGPDSIFDPVVIGRQLRVIDKSRERRPAPEAVVQRFGGGRVARHLLALQRMRAVNPC